MDLISIGWTGDREPALAAAGGGLEAARVVRAIRGVCRIWSASGERDAVLSGSLLKAPASEHPVTGDWVAVEPANGRIRAILPRKSCISRKKAGKEYAEQVLAANVDVLLIVMGLDGDFNPRRLERYLVLAGEGGASPVLVLNKSDVCEDVPARVREVNRITSAAVIVMAAVDPVSVRQLHGCVAPGLTAALAGSSGVGKSTIVNALVGEVRQATLAVREQDSRGRHTTSSRELFLLPEGWLLIDTPGMRELEVWSGDAGEAEVFGDIGQVAEACRFRDCRHEGEPGCAVAEAIAAGVLDQAHVGNFRKLQQESDAQLRKRRARILAKAQKQFRPKW
ncbi:MAG: ribosome small subunit-dependent GTPase A [Bryobacteraceae bacterium]